MENFKRKHENMKFNQVALYSLVIIACIVFLTLGYSTLQASLEISNISAVIRVEKDIRITGVNSTNSTNGANSNYEEYSIHTITSSLNLPNANSTMTYHIEVTNIGNVEQGIYAIDEVYKNINSNTDSNLEIKSKTINIKEALCDDTNSTQCKLGSVTTFDITIGYKNNGYDGTNLTHLVELDFDFRRMFNITYTGFSGSTSGLPNQMIDGDTLAITFDNTSGIPTSVTVTGANGSYTSPSLSLTNVTDNITITATNNVVSDKAYTTLINIYNNSIPSEDNSCENSLLYDNTSDSNLRFVGSNPCNYVYFNCSDPDNPTSSTCEKWRIIGIFQKNNNSVLKIINSTFYNNGNTVQYHNKNSASNRLWGTNTFSDTLNQTYYNNMANADSHNYIESVNWPVGGPSSNRYNVLTFYNSENNSFSSSALPFGLLNITDIVYATNASNRDTNCLNITLNNLSSTCLNNSNVDWLYSGTTEFTISTDDSRYIYKMQNNYIPYTTKTNDSYSARVVTHLKTNVYFDGGNGSNNTPYILRLYN